GKWGLVVLLIAMILFWGILIGGVTLVVRLILSLGGGRKSTDALAILKQRYARGGIDPEEYERMREEKYLWRALVRFLRLQIVQRRPQRHIVAERDRADDVRPADDPRELLLADDQHALDLLGVHQRRDVLDRGVFAHRKDLGAHDVSRELALLREQIGLGN